MTIPELTIIMPVYNSESFLEEAIIGILNQTYTDFNFLISDNFSNDDSYKICENFQKKDQRIKLYKQKKNLGAALNIKFLLEKVKTKFFMIAASDDILSLDWIEKLMNLQYKKKCIAYGDTIFINDIGENVLHQSAISNQKLKGFSLLRRLSFYFKSGMESKMIPFWGIFPTNIMKDICVFETGLLNDKNTYCMDTRIVFKAIKFLEIHQIRTTFLYKRIHNNADSRNPANVDKNENKVKNQFLIVLKAIFRIHQSDGLWNDLTIAEKILIYPIGLFLYPKSVIVSLSRLIIFFLKKFFKRSSK